MDRDNLMTALRNAHTAGDTVSAQRLAQMIHSLDAKPERSFGEMLYENVIGRGEVDTVGEKIGEAFYENVIGRGEVDTPGEKLATYIRGGGAATARGIADIAALPVNVAQLGAMGVEKALGMEEPSMVSRGLAALPDTRDILGAIPVIGPESRYVAPDTVGEYISTAGEFMGGGILAGPKAALKYGATAGLASEAAGQATEGTAIEPYARFAGGMFAPLAVNTANRTVNATFQRAANRPSVETLRAAKNAAYDAVDATGLTIPASVIQNIASRARDAAAARNYVPDVDNQTRGAIVTLDNLSDSSLTIGQLDNVRQRLNNRYKAAPDEVAILDIIDIIDESIGSMPEGGELLTAARQANSHYKKAELFENAFQRAADQAASTGSGGNTVNKFRQAVTTIINNPRQAKFFSQPEIDVMRRFVRGNLPENVLRLVGKMSPSGNGLMMTLHMVGGVMSNAATLPLMLGGEAARRGSMRMAANNAEQLKDMAATGRMPQSTTRSQMATPAVGLLSQAADPAYNPLTFSITQPANQ
jgi:hypothetical protein